MNNTNTQNEIPARRAVHWRLWLAIASLVWVWMASLGTFLVVAPIMSYINQDIGPITSYTWLASSYTLVSGVTVILAGTLSDLVGRRWFCIGTGLSAAIAGIISGTATNMSQAIAGTAILGLNGGGCFMAFPAVSELIPTDSRGYIFALMNMGTVAWTICGSFIGHEIAVNTSVGWRGVFWIITALNGSAALFVFLAYFPATPLAVLNQTQRRRDVFKDFDYIGTAGIIVGPTLFLIGIIWIPEYGATSAEFLAPFLVGTLTMLLLGVWEVYGAKNPLLHPFLFRQVRTFTMILVVALVGGMLFYSLNAFFPMYLAILFDGDDGRQIGIDGMPFGAGANIGGIAGSILLPFISPIIGTHVMLGIGVVLQLVFIPLMCLPNLGSKGLALAFSCLGGIGIGMVEFLTILLIQLATPPEWLGFANGALGLARYIGGSAGSAVYSAIYKDKLAKLFPQWVSSAALSNGLPESSLSTLLEPLASGQTAALTNVPGATPSIIDASAFAYKQASKEAFKYVWLSSIAFGVTALVCALMSKDLSHKINSEVLQRLESDIPIEDKEMALQHVEDVSGERLSK